MEYANNIKRITNMIVIFLMVTLTIGLTSCDDKNDCGDIVYLTNAISKYTDPTDLTLVPWTNGFMALAPVGKDYTLLNNPERYKELRDSMGDNWNTKLGTFWAHDGIYAFIPQLTKITVKAVTDYNYEYSAGSSLNDIFYFRAWDLKPILKAAPGNGKIAIMIESLTPDTTFDAGQDLRNMILEYPIQIYTKSSPVIHIVNGITISPVIEFTIHFTDYSISTQWEVDLDKMYLD